MLFIDSTNFWINFHLGLNDYQRWVQDSGRGFVWDVGGEVPRWVLVHENLQKLIILCKLFYEYQKEVKQYFVNLAL